MSGHFIALTSFPGGARFQEGPAVMFCEKTHAGVSKQAKQDAQSNFAPDLAGLVKNAG